MTNAAKTLTVSTPWDLVRQAHEKLEETVAQVRTDSKLVHALLQEAISAFERGDLASARELLRSAMNKEFFLFGQCTCTGDEALLKAFGIDPHEGES